MVHVEAITEPGNTSCDLVELDALLAAICEERVRSALSVLMVFLGRGKDVNIPRFLTYMMSDV